jgi:hypothetical protein
VMGPSKVQKYWSNKVQNNRHGRHVKRIATVRPRIAWAPPRAIQGLLDPRRFRVTTQNPILQIRAIVDRIIETDGSVRERAVHDQFVMSRTTATQTAVSDDVVPKKESSEIATQTRETGSNEIATQTMEGGPRSMNNDVSRSSISTQTVMSYVMSLQTENSEEEWEIISDEEEEAMNEIESNEDSDHECGEDEIDDDEMSEGRSVNSDNEETDQESDDSEDDPDDGSTEEYSESYDTDGTPVQDEHEEE